MYPLFTIKNNFLFFIKEIKSNMKGIIYKWTCSETGKSYIGQTINEERREKEFFSKSEPYTKKNSKIDNARKKYGLSKDMWKKDVLKRLWCKDGKESELLERLNYWEKHYINEYDTFNNGYNSTDGGGHDFLVTKEVKEKLRDKGKEWWHNLSKEEKSKHAQKSKDWWDGLSSIEKENHVNKSANWWTKLSEKEKNSYVNECKKRNKEWWNNLPEEKKEKHKTWLGKNRYASTCEKLRQKNFGKTISNETRKKLKNSLLNADIKQRKKIMQFDLNGNFIKEYPSLSQMHRETGFNCDNISRCAKSSQNKSCGYIWKFSEEYINRPKENKGYYFYKRLGKYKTRLRYNGKEYTLGFYRTEKAASEMYKYACENKDNIDEWFKDIEKHKKYIMDKYGN